jgi:hypothetical protein
MVPALEGPNVRRVNPVGVGRPGGLCYPQVKTCGYPRLASAGACDGPINSPFHYRFLSSRIAVFGYGCSE